MSPRLILLNLWLRAIVKQALRRMKDPRIMRDRLERDAARIFVSPRDMNRAEHRIARSDGTMMDGLWVSRGRPDRHRVILYLHGGAYLAGSSRTHAHLGAWLAGAAGGRALLPDYRLAPEHPFPAAVEDALTAYRHLLDAGYDPARIALAGDSAGGGLVHALLLRAARAGLPPPACTAAFSPWADMTGTAASLRDNARRDVMLPASRMGDVIDFYLAGHDCADPLASPVFGTFTAPPPALILVSRREILLGDANLLVAKLRASGGDVRLERWGGVPHAWPVFAGRIREADRAIRGAGQFIARHLGG